MARVDADDHRSEAARLYNACWSLLELPERTATDDHTLLTNAFASRHHWRQIGGLEQWVISDWMVSRAAAAVGEPHLAVAFATLAHDEAQANDAADWLVASTAEGLARAYAAAGDGATRERWLATARQLTDAISDDESRAIIAEQLASVPPPAT